MAIGKTQPMIVIKRKGGHGGHHGGAWKVAYADFVTAMMSLFIVLWLMNSSDKIKKAVAGYFNDPKGTASLMGTTMSGNGVNVTQANNEQMKLLKEKLEAEIAAKKELEKLKNQIEMTVTPEGLRIEMLEDKNGTFFESGGAKLSQPVLFGMGRDRTVPGSFRRVSRFRTPVAGLIVMGVIPIIALILYLASNSLQKTIVYIDSTGGLLFAAYYVVISVYSMWYYR